MVNESNQRGGSGNFANDPNERARLAVRADSNRTRVPASRITSPNGAAQRAPADNSAAARGPLRTTRRKRVRPVTKAANTHTGDGSQGFGGAGSLSPPGSCQSNNPASWCSLGRFARRLSPRDRNNGAPGFRTYENLERRAPERSALRERCPD